MIELINKKGNPFSSKIFILLRPLVTSVLGTLVA